MKSVTRPGGESGTGEESTRHHVLQELFSNGPATAAELAERLGVTPAAIRRHLGVLEVGGRIVERERPVRGRRGRGRPAKEYVLTDRGRSAFFQDYDTLALEALSALVEAAGPSAVVRVGERRHGEVEARYRQLRAEAPDADPVEALATVLGEEGYAAHVREAPGGHQLCQYHCPVAHVAARYPQLCEAETSLFARLLGSRVQRIATIAHGDGVCTTNVPLDGVPIAGRAGPPAGGRGGAPTDHRSGTSTDHHNREAARA
ncbi:helix-turn-helix domain-containing protein [Propionibacterium acidifaciens]|uniref:helix-turn-helix transcriptional regulator n=1 Tax=Propionibacterium acidifaciens TaxID=556499 RepID=UPI0028DB32BE|nr:helix-turn-helix domain-containing protein [Propionibacterium acidifaciens]